MNHPDYDYMIVMERRRDELAAAEHSRLLKQARAAKRLNAAPRQPSSMRRLGDALVMSLARFLNAAGEWLLGVSCRIQSRRQARAVLLRGELPEQQPSPCA